MDPCKNLKFSGANAIIYPVMRLSRLQLKNYKMFRHVDLRDIPALAVFVGANGSGKTTLFDAFNFLRASIRHGARAALNMGGYIASLNGGGERLAGMRTRGEEGPIEMAMDFCAELEGSERTFSYLLQIGEGADGEPVVERETLSYPLGGKMTTVLDFHKGKGSVVTNESECEKNGASPKIERETIKPDSLAVRNVCDPERYKAAGVLRKFVRSWCLFDFHHHAARRPREIDASNHLNEWGSNLAGFVRFMQDKHPDDLQAAMKKMSRRVPGFSHARAEKAEDGKIRLIFHEERWPDPFSVDKMSDGTLKMLGILSLLHDPNPSPLLCVEEPEKEVYPHLLEELVEDFHRYTDRSGGNVLVSTHSYELLNAAEPEEVFLLEKQDGVTKIRCAGENKRIRDLIDEGDVMGRLWRMDKLMEPLG